MRLNLRQARDLIKEIATGLSDYSGFAKRFSELVNEPPFELRHWHNPDADYDDALWIDVPMRIATQFWTRAELEAGQDGQDEHGPWAMILGDEVTLGGGA